MSNNERAAVITGTGMSQVGRRLMRDPLELTLDACIAAVEDAGLTLQDIDGLSTYPGMGGPQGFSGAGAIAVHDALRLETIRSVRGAVRNREIEDGSELDDGGIERVIRSLVKQRTDAIEQYGAAGRSDLVDKETSERDILLAYLPAAPDAADVERVVAEVIAEGIETDTELRILRELGVRYGQGYYFGAALSGSD